jgi:hypothetical protein
MAQPKRLSLYIEAIYLPGAPGVRPLAFAAPAAASPAGPSPDAARPGGIAGASGGGGGGVGVHPIKKLPRTIPQNQLLRDIENLKSRVIFLYICYSFVWATSPPARVASCSRTF